jgi:hypothetical protein
MIEKYHFLSSDFQWEAPRELMLLSVISQSLFQPFSLQDNLLVILTALTSGSGVGFNRAMLFLRDGDRLQGEMWLGPRSSEEAGFIWEVLSTPGIGYVEIVEHNRSLISRNQDSLSRRVRNLGFDIDEANCRIIPALAACNKEMYLVRDARSDPRVDPRLADLIQVDEFLCIPLLARDTVLGEIIVDNAITGVPIGVSDIKLAGLCGLIAGNIIYTTILHEKLLDAEKMATMGELAMFVTHQLRTPLVTIGGFTDQLLRPDTGEDKKARNLLIIRDEIRRLEGIVYQMGHFLKVSMKEPVFFDPAPVIDAVVRSPDVQAKAQAYALNVRLAEEPPEILCDPTVRSSVTSWTTLSTRAFREGRSQSGPKRTRTGSSSRSGTRAAAFPTRTGSSCSGPFSRPRKRGWAWVCRSPSGSWIPAAAGSKSRAGWARGPCSG